MVTLLLLAIRYQCHITYQLVLDQEADSLSNAGRDHVGGVRQEDGALGFAAHFWVHAVLSLICRHRLIAKSPRNLQG